MLDELNLEFPEWSSEIDENGDFLEKSDERLRNNFYKIIFEIKAFCIDSGLSVEEIVEKISDKKKNTEIIIKNVNNCLTYYKILSPIRELSFQDEKGAKAFLRDCFDNYIIRLDYKISEKYNFLDEEKVNKMLAAIDRLTDYYVERLLVKKEVENDFKGETGISNEVCSYYAELYESNFQELKFNLILNKLNNLEDMLIRR